MKVVVIKNILISLIVTLFISGCSSMSIIKAPNGKDYYVDLETCDKYVLIRDTLFCYQNENKKLRTQYHPITFGYKIQTRESY